MKISYLKGDFTEGVTIIVHGCNAQGVMGSGAALAIKQKMPWAYHAYHNAHKDYRMQLGDVIWAMHIINDARPRVVGNMITQQHYGKEPKRYVDYDAVRKCIREVDRFMLGIKDGTIDIAALGGKGGMDFVGMPMIGAGLGGGDWDVISTIIEEESQSFTPVVYQLT